MKKGEVLAILAAALTRTYPGLRGRFGADAMRDNDQLTSGGLSLPFTLSASVRSGCDEVFGPLNRCRPTTQLWRSRKKTIKRQLTKPL
jgi:hypothetical protein